MIKQPKSLKYHGLQGIKLQQQHMMIESQDLSEQFGMMTKFMAQHQKFQCMESASRDKENLETYQRLLKECRNARNQLNEIKSSQNQDVIRNFFKDNKEKQCMYGRMPVKQIEEDIDQKNFSLRKDYDRLSECKRRLEKQLKNLLLSKNALEQQAKYSNHLPEEKRIYNCQQQLSNSTMRLQAVKIINGTYKKIRNALKNDEIFYEPILRSLSDDIKEQNQFIQQTLNLGIPAIQEYQKLHEKLKLNNQRVSNDIKVLPGCVSTNRESQRKSDGLRRSLENDRNIVSQAKQQCMRPTKNMSDLESELQRVSEIIKDLKNATECSNPKDIFHRIKEQADTNTKLKKEVAHDSFCYSTMKTKEKLNEVGLDIVKNNFSKAEMDRLERIENLKKLIDNEDAKEEELMKSRKRNADVFVLLKVFLWNMYGKLQYVDKEDQKVNSSVSNGNLHLQERNVQKMCNMPPDAMNENVEDLYKIIHDKLEILLSAYNTLKNDQITKSTNIRKSHHAAVNKKSISNNVTSDNVEQQPESNADLNGDADYDSKELSSTVGKRT